MSNSQPTTMSGIGERRPNSGTQVDRAAATAPRVTAKEGADGRYRRWCRHWRAEPSAQPASGRASRFASTKPSASPAPLGVGINLQPTAVRELTELGLADELARIGNETDRLGSSIGLDSWSGAKLAVGPGYHWPQYSIHRGRLQMLLLSATRDRIGDANVRTGLRLEGFQQEGNG